MIIILSYDDIKFERDLYIKWYNELKKDITADVEWYNGQIKMLNSCKDKVNDVVTTLNGSLVKDKYIAGLEKFVHDIEFCKTLTDTLIYLLEKAEKRENGEIK